MKKFLSLLLAVLMVVGMFPMTVFAEENTVIDVSSNKKPHKWNHVSQITLSGVAVKEYNCTAGDEMTVDIVLDSNTAKDAVFTIDMDSDGNKSDDYPMVYDGAGFDSNGTKEVTLVNGGAVFSVTTTGQYSSKKSETITWNFNISIDGVQAGLSINPEQMELVNIGSTATLTANNAPGEVVWESSDENVVTVDEEGIVTAVGFGTATITATSGEQTAECLVNVIGKTEIDVSTVKKPHATWGYLSTIIVKGMVSVKEWNNDDTTVNISLASDTASDASFELTFSGVAANMNKFDVIYNDESYKNAPLSVTLADGKAEITLKVIGGNFDCEWKINITVAEDDEISTNRTTIKTGAEFVEGAGDAWCEEIIVVGPAVTDSKVTEYSETDRKIVVLLDEATDDSASVKLEFVDAGYKDGSLNLEYTLEKPYSFNLENGKKTVEFETDGNAVTRREYSIILKNSNNAPAIKDGIENVTADWENQATYSVKLSDIFVDADNDALDYSVSVDGTEYPFIGEEWSYKAETVGEHVIVFTASDGLVVSEEYKITLNVFNKQVFFNVDFYVPEEITPDFYVNAGYNGTAGDILGEKLEAVKGETADGFVKYTVAVPENVATVSFRGKDAEGNSWGGATAAVAENCDAIKICKVKGIIETLIDGETPKAEDAEFRFVNADGNYAAKGDSFVEGEHLGYRFLLADGQYTYQAAAAETGSLAEKYGVREKGPEAVSAENAEVKVFALPMCLKNYYTVTAPEGSVVHTGKMNYYFRYYFFEAFREINNGDGTVTFELEVLPYENEDGSVGGSDFIRVQHPDGVTYWDYETKLSNGKELVITEEMLFIGENDGFDADTIFHNFEEYEMDVADIYLNVNKEMYINLDINKTFKLNVFRNWMAINNFSNSCVALPDVTYTVIDENGNASDVVSVKVDKYNSSVADIVANKEGTAIVLVTYDAMYHNGAAHGQLGNEAVTPEKFSAIWPENTGVFVVSVGADGTSIETNMDTDAEHDPIYYVGDEGAEFAFTPEEGCKVSVARATLTADSLTYNGFVTEGVTVNEETGEVTVTGLTQGRHIIRVEKNGVATYQIITTKQTTMVITDNEGNVITEESEVMPGTELKVQFGDIYNPMNKLSGIYNTNCGIQYDGEDGTQFGGDNTGFGDYTFASRYESHAVTIKVPEDWIKDTYTLVGSLHIAGFGSSGGGHRGVCLYETGKAMDTDAPGVSGNPGVLPTITLNVYIPATEISLDKTELELACNGEAELKATVVPEYTTDEIVWASSDEKVVTVDENGKVTAVGAGEATVTATAGDVSATCTVTVAHDMKAATCTEPATCKRGCGYTEGEALGHDEVEHEAKAPTCTEIGWEAYVTCSRCDYSTYDEIEALGHDMADATCTEPATCKRGCGYTEGEALGHDYGEWSVVVPATTEREGVMRRYCENCGAHSDRIIPKLVSPEEKADETNPNTGAPVIGIAPFVVLAAAAIVLKKK
ncbi:MAG: Ig-like domain-containing protein [Oscillospiraceae bacterium]|nr:Ig-like domain-containing protein [Oscillospiraceae bacterium]